MRRVVYSVFAVLPGVLLFASNASAVPQIQNWQHEHDAKVYFVAAPELEIVDIAISYAAGSARDGDLKGLAALTAKLLDDGAAGDDVNTIAETFANNAASFSAGADLDRITVTLRALSEREYLQPALEQMAAVLQQPDFPEQALERERARTIAGLQAKQQSPGDMASEKLYAAVYGSHPYASPVSGTMQSVPKIKREDLLRFHQQYLVAANASVAIVGALSRRQAEQVVELLLGGMRQGQKAEPIAVAGDNTEDTQAQLHPFPSTQKHILLGQVSIAVDNPDRIALHVGNRILGSGMVSRLFRSIREQRGLAYSVYSYFYPLQSPGPFIVGMQTEASQAEQSVQLLLQELREYVNNGPTGQELEDAKSYITGSFASRYSSNAKLAGYLSWMAFYDLPPAYLYEFISRVQAVSVEQVRDSFKKHLRVDELHQVQLGGES